MSSNSDKQSVVSSNYFPKGGYSIPQHRLDPIARALLQGVYDDDHPLSIFRGMRYIIQAIWNLALQFNKQHYAPYIEIHDNPLISSGSTPRSNRGKSVAFKQIDAMQLCYFPYHQKVASYASLKFPKPLQTEININMMPIKMTNKTLLDSLEQQLPYYLEGYVEFIRACLQADPSQLDHICYVTIHESYVGKGKTQRRPGLHIELPGQSIGGKAPWLYGWGGGYYQQDGIFIASNVTSTCAVWNCRIIDKDNTDDDEAEEQNVVDHLGGMEHIRSILPKDKKYILEGGKLYWITDRTPHEVLPMKEAGWRQFFRLVSHKLGVWYEDHSTKNPNGVVPDPRFTKIVKGNKFQSE